MYWILYTQYVHIGHTYVRIRMSSEESSSRAPARGCTASRHRRRCRRLRDKTCVLSARVCCCCCSCCCCRAAPARTRMCTHNNFVRVIKCFPIVRGNFIFAFSYKRSKVFRPKLSTQQQQQQQQQQQAAPARTRIMMMFNHMIL